ncbi:MAG: Thioredoxin protein [Chthonomonadales bacterium]|nr:Thioredoxin protein [Chthonomonadales bacterium]
MATIRTVNLLWERKYRGAYPLARYALDNAGTLTLAIPRPLEARTFDLSRLQQDGAIENRSSFSVETLLKLETSAQADSVIGITADDLYLFHAGNKSRFLPDRRINYVDAALSADGRFVTAAFSDMSGASYALAFGEISGHVAWLRELSAPATAVAMARDGARAAVGMESGAVWLLDASRREVWDFDQEGAAVRALACSEEGLHVVYGLEDGKVGLIGGDGARKWETRLPGEVFALALSSDGSLCAALCRRPDNPASAHIYCLDATGTVGWDFDAEKRLLGLAVSPDGRYLATGARDGTTSVYEVVAAEGSTDGKERRSVGDPVVAAAALRSADDFGGALQILREALEFDPADCVGCDRLLTARDAYLQEGFDEAQKRIAQGEFAPAIALLAALLTEDPLHTEVAQALRGARTQRSAELIAEAHAHSAAGDVGHAEMKLREAIAVAPVGPTPARVELAALFTRFAEAADAEADRLLAQGDLHAGIAALERAQAVAANRTRAQTIGRVQTALEFTIGMAAYNDKRYSEAVFQFKKVLARDPGHAEARRYLNFAQKFAQDATTESLTDRFSRLE